MSSVWSEEGKLARWLEVELAALDGWAELGTIPREDVARIRAAAVPPTPERVAEIELITDHDTAAFVDAVAEQLGPEGRWVHYGLTSSDVVDTALALQIQDAGKLLLAGVERALAAVLRRAEEHRLTICIGRSHGIHAEPTTFGWKLAGWAFELDRDRLRLARALEVNRVGQLSGTVGTYAGLDPEVERIACERLGLEPDPLSTQVIATRPACRAAGGAGARRLVPRPVRNGDPPPRPHRGTRSRGAVREGDEGVVCDAAQAEPEGGRAHQRPRTVVRSAALVGFENVALWHERDISHSSAERVVVPDAFLALDYMLDRFTWIVDGLVVYPERMRSNIDASHGLVFSHRLLLALVETGLPRGEAYGLVQRNAMRAWDEALDFPPARRGRRGDHVPPRRGRTRRRLRSRLDRAARRHRLRPSASLAPKEDPVHV